MDRIVYRRGDLLGVVVRYVGSISLTVTRTSCPLRTSFTVLLLSSFGALEYLISPATTRWSSLTPPDEEVKRVYLPCDLMSAHYCSRGNIILPYGGRQVTLAREIIAPLLYEYLYPRTSVFHSSPTKSSQHAPSVPQPPSHPTQ
jgi:hypothetical protein